MQEENLKNENSKIDNNIYRLAGSIALIFAVPVVIAAFVGTWLDTHYAAGRKYILICMAVAFIFSWVIFIRKYFKIIKQK